MSDLSVALGERIRSCRIGAGLTQEELATKSGLHSSYIGQVERGQKNITVEALSRILRALGMTFIDLFGCFGDPEKPADSIPRECYDLIVQRSEQEQRAIHDIIYAVVGLADGQL